MEESFKQDNIAGKEEKYLHFLEQYSHLIEGEKNIISVLANTTAALKEAFGFFWIGFYLIEEGELHLGPFQGSVACYRIKKEEVCAEQHGQKPERRWWQTWIFFRDTLHAVHFHGRK